MHTPRLCIDARAAGQFPVSGMLAQEVIDQLVSAQGELGISSPWLEKQRTVVLSFADQVFSGQLKRFDTRTGIGMTPLYWLWEKNFVKQAQISAFHRFRPADRLQPTLSCPTITTLLPSSGRASFFISRKEQQWYVVPSHLDKVRMTQSYEIPEERIFAVTPGVRRFVHHTEPPKAAPEGWILFLLGEKHSTLDRKKLIKVVRDRHPELPHKMISLQSAARFSPLEWRKLLQNTKFCFYLTARPFDWPMLPLEALYWNIPTLFLDAHPALSELIPAALLRISRYLIDQPDFTTLKKMAVDVRKALFERGVFAPYALARSFGGIYAKLPIEVEGSLKVTQTVQPGQVSPQAY